MKFSTTEGWHMGYFVGFILIIIAIIAILGTLGVLAKRTHGVHLQLPAEDARRIVLNTGKGVLWPAESGPGEFNFRRRGPTVNRMRPSTLSVDVTAQPDGSSIAEFWMSTYHTYMGIPNGGDQVLLRRRKIIRALRKAETARLEGAATTFQQIYNPPEGSTPPPPEQY